MIQQLMNMQGRSQSLSRGQQNNRNYTNRPQLTRSMLKLKPSNSFKAAMNSKIAADVYPLTVANKLKNFKYKTQQNSPVHQKINSINTIHFPQLFIDTNFQQIKQFLPKQRHLNAQKNVSKTVVILDSLMSNNRSILELLKDENQSQKIQHKKQHKYEGLNQFAQCQKIKRDKRPKLIKNQITKKFFQKPNKQRKIQSQQKMRINRTNLFNDKINEYTFYGGDFYPLRMHTDTPIQTKAQLNQIRINKLHKSKI